MSMIYDTADRTVPVSVSDVLEMSAFWERVAAHPANNDATRKFALAEADHWRGVAEGVTGKGVIA